MKAGTIIFADVSGLHKGGLALLRDRKLLYVGFISPNAWRRPKKRPVFTGVDSKLHPAKLYATYQI